MSPRVLSEQACMGGVQGFYELDSAACAGPMRYGLFRPPQAGPRPTVFFLAGLTCNEQTFAIKAGAQRLAARLGLCLVTPDTSPRATRLLGDDADCDFGQGAGFYLDATAAPWAGVYGMARFVGEELPQVVVDHHGADPARLGIGGHSMGGHGALVLGLRHPQRFRSISAFAPICAPMSCPWGEKALSGYLGPDRRTWAAWDATALLAAGRRSGEILVDQGLSDAFLEQQLHPHLLEQACAQAGQPLRLRRHAGYDHSYWFISTFVEDHLHHHARLLQE